MGWSLRTMETPKSERVSHAASCIVVGRITLPAVLWSHLGQGFGLFCELRGLTFFNLES